MPKILFPYLDDHLPSLLPGLANIPSPNSELRWTVNVARLFKEAGWEIYCSKIFDRDHYTQVSDIKTLPAEEIYNQKFDLSFTHAPIVLENPTWWERMKICCNAHLIGDFHAQDFHRSFPDTKFIRVTPFWGNDSVLTLPFAWGIEKPVQPKFENHGIAWTVRGPYTVSYDGMTPELRSTTSHLDISCQLHKEGYKLAFFQSFFYKFERNNMNNPCVARAINKINALYNTECKFFDTLLYNDFRRELGNYSVSIPLNGLSAVHDAVSLGLVPLVWGPVAHVFKDFPFTPKNFGSLNGDEIRDRLVRLLTDVSFFEREFYNLYNTAAIFSKDEAMSLLNTILSRI